MKVIPEMHHKHGIGYLCLNILHIKTTILWYADLSDFLTAETLIKKKKTVITINF